MNYAIPRPPPLRRVELPQDHEREREPLRIVVEVPERVRHVQAVIDAVCAAYGVSEADIRGPRRMPEIAHARHECMRQLAALGWSPGAIGRALGRERTTVLHGVKAATRRLGR